MLTLISDVISHPVYVLNGGLMLGQHARRCPNIKPSLVQCIVFIRLLALALDVGGMTWSHGTQTISQHADQNKY